MLYVSSAEIRSLISTISTRLAWDDVTMNKFLCFAACVGLAGLMSGCAYSDYSLNNPFKNRPIRTKIRSWCGGDPCSTCSPPCGQPINCDSNVAPLCDSCAPAGSLGQPVYSGNADPGVQLYEDPNLNAPMSTPIYNQRIENPSPIYPDGVQIQNGAIGTGVANEAVMPPNF